MSKNKLHINLSDFVETTIVEVVMGVKQAADNLVSVDSNFTRYEKQELVGPRSEVRNIEFDLSISAEEGTRKDGDGGIKIKVVNFTASRASSNNSTETARIKFDVPVFLPSAKKT